ncbi:MAG: AraC family transcriptional regulator [Lachnospiraceae bacterium]|nr:AraC family transcriptional regulator [Lachnospiraceae bacterium]
MAKPKKTVIEYRNYELPQNFPVLLLTGEGWHISDIRSNTLHIHNCLEIGICHTDSGIIEFANQPLPFQAGDVSFISRNLAHTTYSTKGSASLWSYIFVNPEEMLHGYYDNSFPYADLFHDMTQNIHAIYSRDDHREITYLVLQIMEELKHKEMNYQVIVRGLFLALFMKLLRIYKSDISAEADKEAQENSIVIAPALDYIRDHYMQSFAIEDLAQMCHLSETHFRRVFHDIMNTSPLNYLNTTRILAACTLLRSTEDSVLSISEQVGFHSVSSFNRHFAEIMGTQPTAWRKKTLQVQNASILKYSGWMESQKL